MFHRFTAKFSSFSLLVMLALFACTPPLDVETRIQIALDNEQRGESVAALLELKNILQSDPDHLRTLTLLGRLSTEVGQSAEAVEYLSRARKLGATGPEISESLGKALLAQGQFERLLAELKTRPSASANSNANIELLRGEALLGLGRLDEAEDAFRRVGAEQSTAATGLTGEARAAIFREQYDEAEKLINLALEKDPFSVAAFRALGSLRHKQERFAEAESAFISAVEATTIRQASDELLLARVGLAESQWRMGEKGKALGNVKDLLDAYPWHPLPLYLRALFSYDSGEYRMATEYLREVRLAVPSHRPSQQLMAASEFELGRYSNVEQLLRDYLKDEPDDIEMRRLLARTHLQMGNPTGALATLLPVVNLAPQDAGFLALLGRASLHSGDAELAATYLERAIENAPDDDDIRVSLIVAQIGAGKTDSAEQNLAKLPDNPATQRARSLLELVLLMRKAENERALLYAKQLRQSVPANLHAMLALAELAET
ncbi:MAG: tetratricopeptide repeat protein, partial [Gammaproteobacteria bacterium]|nr:tetratricopeptide repeat protein [Gammaproteobacteria bacterium]